MPVKSQLDQHLALSVSLREVLESRAAVHAAEFQSEQFSSHLGINLAVMHPPTLTDWNCSSLLALMLAPAINILM